MPTAKRKSSQSKKGRAGLKKTSATKKSKSKRGAKKVAGKINFIPNDPLAVKDLAMRTVAPRRDPTGSRAKFAFAKNMGSPARSAAGTKTFLFWQSREAALAAVETFGNLGGPLPNWASDATRPLPLKADAGKDLNAYYNRRSVSFFHYPVGKSTVFSGESTDVVAHEVGHAILDSLRPDLWASSLPEHAAFHEAFGDCIAILTAFNDPATCSALVAITPKLSAANFVESTAEALSDAVRRAIGPQHPASQPRQALNKYRWRLPSTLPTTGGPAVLTGEPHSFARVFTGCFYDTIRNIFTSHAPRNAASLATAARTAGALLVEGARNAVEGTRFYEAVGVAMLAADQSANAGTNSVAITKAFEAHGITLAQPARAFQERSRVAGGQAKKGRAVGAVSAAKVSRELKSRMGAKGTGALQSQDFMIGAERASKFVNTRQVALDGISEQLKGVVAPAPEPVVVAGIQRGYYAATRSAIPESHSTEDEVRFFAMTLVANGNLEVADQVPARASAVATAGSVAAVATRSARKTTAAVAAGVGTPVTHAIRTKGGKRVLTRVRFACGCGCRWSRAGSDRKPT